jgi:hypothetical protein
MEARRTFAIGSGNMDAAQLVVWVIQVFEKRCDINQVCAVSGFAYPLVHG